MDNNAYSQYASKFGSMKCHLNGAFIYKSTDLNGILNAIEHIQQNRKKFVESSVNIEDFKKALEDNQAVIFIGNDVSAYTTNFEQFEATYKGLLKNGLQKCYEFNLLNDMEYEFHCKKLCTVETSTEEIVKIADNITEKLKLEYDEKKFNLFESWLKETVGSLTPKNVDLITSIGKLECPIFTTNYDCLIETVLNRKPLTWLKYENEENKNCFDELKNYVVHVNGYYEDVNSITMDTEGYKALSKNEFAQGVLKTLMLTKSVLFIGYGLGMSDPNYNQLLDVKYSIADHTLLPIYKLVNSNESIFNSFDNLKTIKYGNTNQKLVQFIRSFELNKNEQKLSINITPIDRKLFVLKKYLNFVLEEYGNISIFGYSKTELKLELQKVFVQLKFEPSHPSLVGMKSLAIEEVFKRRILDRNFFGVSEKTKIFLAYTKLCGRDLQNINNLCKNLLIEPWLNNLLSNTEIFDNDERNAIKSKIQKLKRDVIELSGFKIEQNCTIKDAYQEFKHLVVLGNPGCGKTTLSKWLVTNMAKQGLNIENDLFHGQTTSFKYKLPILIPFWKYVEELNMKNEMSDQRKSLLQFIYENPTVGSTYFENCDEKQILSEIVMESLMKGNTLVILEGLDEIPIYINRSELMTEINSLLERTICRDKKHNRLSYLMHEHKEICGTVDVDFGNRFIITSRIEGNYFQDINYYIPRLTIEDMTYEALESFCYSYMTCINKASTNIGIINDFDPKQLFNDIKMNDDILKLAINPQLASVIASIYNQCGGVLPDKRIDLYQKAIDKMIERLVEMISTKQKLPFLNSFSQQVPVLNVNRTVILSIMQEIAEYLHARTEGLSENMLKTLIRDSLIEYQKTLNVTPHSDFEELTAYIVNLLKVHSGLLTEFGHNSFKFLHRTFQEYLAAMNIIYNYGIERDETTILNSISVKIPIPNWRLPLSMSFGILSKSTTNRKLFDNIITKLIENEYNSAETKISSYITPYIIVDSLIEISFPSIEKAHELIEILLEKLLLDFTNKSGFSRIKEHQDLSATYFNKLSKLFPEYFKEWFYQKLSSNEENSASCAKLLLDTGIYDVRFHQIFVKNLHNDSRDFNWPIDSILRSYITKKEFCDELLFKEIENFKELYESSLSSGKKEFYDILLLIIALYGGYDRCNTITKFYELHELSSFLGLSENERKPFTFYYEEIWGRDEMVYRMDVQISKIEEDLRKNSLKGFSVEKIYKLSSITNYLIEYLQKPSFSRLKETLKDTLNSVDLELNDKIDRLIALTTLGEVDFVIEYKNKLDYTSLDRFKNRIEQLIYLITDQVVRISSQQMVNYLITTFEFLNRNDKENKLNFLTYCKTHLLLLADINSNPINTCNLFKRFEKNTKIKSFRLNDLSIKTLKSYFYSEYLVYILTGVPNGGDTGYFVYSCLNKFECDLLLFVEAILNTSNCKQFYKPIRSCFWSVDQFLFKTDVKHVPISFFNYLDNLNRRISGSVKDWIFKTLVKEKITVNSPDLAIIFALYFFGDISENAREFQKDVFEYLLPEFYQQENHDNVKEYLLNKINSFITEPYCKCRALFMLARYYDAKAISLLTEAYELTKMITDGSSKFQVLEEILCTLYYKYDDELEGKKEELLTNIENDLINIPDKITDRHDKVIALVRLMFHVKCSERFDLLKKALDVLKNVEYENEKIDLIIKLRPLVHVYNDLNSELEQIIDNLNNQNDKYYVNSNCGRILIENEVDFNENNMENNLFMNLELHSSLEVWDVDLLGNMNGLFKLYALLKEVTERPKTVSDLLIALLNDPNNNQIIQQIIEIGVVDGIILTPEIILVIDEFIQNRINCVYLIFPYLVKPSNEVYPILYRWMNHENNNVKALGALLLSESKWIFTEAVDSLIELLNNENDQLRYRAQNIFQHPEREPDVPNKRISLIGENTLFKLFCAQLTNIKMSRVCFYLEAFFWNLLWDCPQVYENLYNKINFLKSTEKIEKCIFFNKIRFMDEKTWNKLVTTLISSTDSFYIRELFTSVMQLLFNNNINRMKWGLVSKVFMDKNLSDFTKQTFLTENDMNVISYIIEQSQYYLDNEIDMEMSSIEFIEKKIIETKTIAAQNVFKQGFEEVYNIYLYNYRVSTENLNESILDHLKEVPMTLKLFESLLNWLVHRIKIFNRYLESAFSKYLTSCLLSLVASLAQKDDFIYRKLTNSLAFNKSQYIKLLDDILHNHPYFIARGSSFILLALLDNPDVKILVNALNILLDENLAKRYSIIGIPLIRLSPNVFTDEILKSLKSDSAVKVYELLKIITGFAMNDKIDASTKSKILNFIVKESSELSSKRPVSFYYTDVKIPFTTTIEKELYKSWIKIQGLLGKNEFQIRTDKN